MATINKSEIISTSKLISELVAKTLVN